MSISAICDSATLKVLCGNPMPGGSVCRGVIGDIHFVRDIVFIDGIATSTERAVAVFRSARSRDDHGVYRLSPSARAKVKSGHKESDRAPRRKRVLNTEGTVAETFVVPRDEGYPRPPFSAECPLCWGVVEVSAGLMESVPIPETENYLQLLVDLVNDDDLSI